MANEIQTIGNAVGKAVTPGTIVEGTIIKMWSGRADDFMTAEQCAARKTEADTRYISLEIGIGEYGIKEKSFPDYSNPDDPSMPINPNSIHGRVMTTYPNIGVETPVKMICNEKERNGSKLIVWELILV